MTSGLRYFDVMRLRMVEAQADLRAFGNNAASAVTRAVDAGAVMENRANMRLDELEKEVKIVVGLAIMQAAG